MRWYLGLVFALIPIVATANIYRSLDASGNVVYSDKPSSGATPIDLPPLQGYSPATTSPPTNVASAQPTTVVPASAVKTDADYYQILRITAPVEQATVQNADGQLDVVVSMLPSLRAGDKLVITVDDEPVVETPNANVSFVLQNVPRGTHRLQAHIIGSDAHLLKTSDNIIFHMHQTSISQINALFPTPASASPATADASASAQMEVMK